MSHLDVEISDKDVIKAATFFVDQINHLNAGKVQMGKNVNTKIVFAKSILDLFYGSPIEETRYQYLFQIATKFGLECQKPTNQTTQQQLIDLISTYTLDTHISNKDIYSQTSEQIKFIDSIKTWCPDLRFHPFESIISTATKRLAILGQYDTLTIDELISDVLRTGTKWELLQTHILEAYKSSQLDPQHMFHSGSTVIRRDVFRAFLGQDNIQRFHYYKKLDPTDVVFVGDANTLMFLRSPDESRQFITLQPIRPTLNIVDSDGDLKINVGKATIGSFHHHMFGSHIHTTATGFRDNILSESCFPTVATVGYPQHGGFSNGSTLVEQLSAKERKAQAAQCRKYHELNYQHVSSHEHGRKSPDVKTSASKPSKNEQMKEQELINPINVDDEDINNSKLKKFLELYQKSVQFRSNHYYDLTVEKQSESTKKLAKAIQYQLNAERESMDLNTISQSSGSHQFASIPCALLSYVNLCRKVDNRQVLPNSSMLPAVLAQVVEQDANTSKKNVVNLITVSQLKCLGVGAENESFTFQLIEPKTFSINLSKGVSCLITSNHLVRLYIPSKLSNKQIKHEIGSTPPMDNFYVVDHDQQMSCGLLISSITARKLGYSPL